MKYYVYELISPIDDKPFYIGKGTGRRMYVHEFRARRPVAEPNENKKLRNKIKSILNNGKSVKYNQIFFTDDAMEAYVQESKRIQEIGLENLCNRFIFPPTTDDIYKLIAMRRNGYKTPEKTKRKISQTLQGHSVSAEARKKISLSQIGKKRPCSERRRIAIAKAKSPKQGFPLVVSPEGKIFCIEILTDFCKKHGLHLSGMSGLLKRYKNAKSHRGWRLADNQRQ